MAFCRAADEGYSACNMVRDWWLSHTCSFAAKSPCFHSTRHGQQTSKQILLHTEEPHSGHSCWAPALQSSRRLWGRCSCRAELATCQRRQRAGTSVGPECLFLQQQQFWLYLKGLPDVLAWKKADLATGIAGWRVCYDGREQESVHT